MKSALKTTFFFILLLLLFSSATYVVTFLKIESDHIFASRETNIKRTNELFINAINVINPFDPNKRKYHDSIPDIPVGLNNSPPQK